MQGGRQLGKQTMQQAEAQAKTKAQPRLGNVSLGGRKRPSMAHSGMCVRVCAGGWVPFVWVREKYCGSMKEALACVHGMETARIAPRQ
jgi:hypothetical protein